MKFSKFFLMALASCVFLITGCGAKSPLKFEEKVSGKIALEPVSFMEVKNKIFIPKCIVCHGQAGNVNLETYEQAVAHLQSIKKSTLIDKRMPRAGFDKLTTAEELLLKAWIEAGGPEKPLDGSPAPAPLPVEKLLPTFASIKKLIIDRKCLNCHRADGSAPRVLLNTAQEMIDSPLEIVIPENADESGLILVLDRENATKPMPPIKTGISEVTQAEREIIRTWIMNGAKD